MTFFRKYFTGRRAFAPFLCAALAASLAASATTLPMPPSRAVEAINTTELRMHLEFLASKELGGRYTLSPGIRIAARYLASRLEAYGYRGVGPGGSYLQPFDVVQSKVDAAKSRLTLTVDGKTTEYAYGDFAAFDSGPGSAEGPIVFAGYGISSPAQRHDDYANLDVKGKIVLVAPGTPAGVDSSKLGPQEKEIGAALAHGAVGMLELPKARYASFARSPGYKDWVLARENIRVAAVNGPTLPCAQLPSAVADRVLAAVGLTVEKVYEASAVGSALAPKATGASAKMTLAMDEQREAAENVVGVLEGADAKLKDEYIVLSAHYDHLKTGANGEVFPGADDDGSGTAAVLALAQAFSVERPKRSVFVIFHSGEELGLLGSEYNTDVAPAVPLEKIVANFNIDMIGRSRAPGDKNPKNSELTGPDGVYVIGSDRISAELHEISERTNADFEKLKLDYTYNDPNHPQQFYYRSDHWNYAKHGIPVIFYFSGVHEDYHAASDTIDKIDFDKMERVTRLVFATGWRVANLDHRLRRGAK